MATNEYLRTSLRSETVLEDGTKNSEILLCDGLSVESVRSENSSKDVQAENTQNLPMINHGDGQGTAENEAQTQTSVANVQTTLHGILNTLAQIRTIHGTAQAVEPCQMVDQNRTVEHNLKPQIYDGTTSWSDYLIQFELVAELNRWDDVTKALYLATSLRSVAQSILEDLDPIGRRHFPSLVDRLSQRFGTENQTELFWVLLNNRTQKPKETLPELAHEIRRLCRLAHPTAQYHILEDLAKKHFINALQDTAMRLHILHSKPETMDDAVKIAVETEAFYEAEKFRSGSRKPVRAIASEDMPEQISTILEQIQGSVQKLIQKMDSLNKAENKSAECYFCGKPGHIKKNCRKLRKVRRKQNANPSFYHKNKGRHGRSQHNDAGYGALDGIGLNQFADAKVDGLTKSSSKKKGRNNRRKLRKSPSSRKRAWKRLTIRRRQLTGQDTPLIGKAFNELSCQPACTPRDDADVSSSANDGIGMRRGEEWSLPSLYTGTLRKVVPQMRAWTKSLSNSSRHSEEAESLEESITSMEAQSMER